MKFAVIGGDLRAARLCALLRVDGHTVRAFALEKAELDADITPCASAAEAAMDADCAILPLPVTNQRGRLNTPLSARVCPVSIRARLAIRIRSFLRYFCGVRWNRSRNRRSKVRTDMCTSLASCWLVTDVG